MQPGPQAEAWGPVVDSWAGFNVARHRGHQEQKAAGPTKGGRGHGPSIRPATQKRGSEIASRVEPMPPIRV